ncbi:tyrosine-type recombinase/integrase [Pseudodesulfovibrio tunisiensis]|uniref:tyrosine-type recombinase/integrase n=1 Tax=Pseudodesulfovibrio tunisiensis TaxID=463192 RepID=UPI001FB1F531|nr:site-specific integrase [Pseudodesulfovibrio tunisiensis]
MATIQKRGKHQWQVKIRRKGYPQQSKTFERKTDAEQWARDIENEMDRGVFVSRKEAESTTLYEALDRFIQEYIPNLKMVATETRRAKAIQKRDIAKHYLATIRTKDIADFIREREQEGVKGNTIRLDLATLSRLFEIAATDWGMESLTNPVKRTRKPKLEGGRTRRLEPAQSEEERLLEACSIKFRPVVQFALETAMRRSEIANLEWNNIDLKGRTAYLADTKNKSERTVPLSPAAICILKGIPRQLSGSVFGMSENAITIAMRRAREAAGIPNLTFHDLRHEATSRFFENTDLDIMEIAEITGHKNLQMLKRYTHLRTERLADRLAGKQR